MEFFLFLSAILGALLIWLVYPDRMSRMARNIPGPRAYPIVGNIFNFIVMGPKAIESWRKHREKYGNAFRVWLGPQLHIFLFDPDDIQMILTSNTLLKKSASYDELVPWLGTGLLVSTGKLWQMRRKAITPTFHFKILDEFVPIFNKCSKVLRDCLKDKVGKGAFQLTEYMSNCALDAIAETAMGTEIKAQTNPHGEYPTSVLKMTAALMEKIGNPLLNIEPFYTISGRRKRESDLLKILFSLPMEVIKGKRYSKTTHGNGKTSSDEVYGIKKKTAFLQLLLEMKQNNAPAFRTDRDVQDEVITFMFEGHDTTTMSLTFTTWLLGTHLDIQEKLYHEVSDILQGKEEPSIEDYSKMVYLERVIKESLRLYPSVPIVAREATEDIYLKSSRILVPKGAHITMGIYELQRREDLFPDAERFNPDRFLEPQKHQFAYLPFSAGPRNCIGQKFAMLEMKVVISNLVLNYKIKSEKDIVLSPEMLLRCEKGPNISLTPRN
ncbi:cytochrome P450 4C1 [Halyomorpha halys]|uniref:cytochrome P450 4C1 n=1 Tax=Halyomorpha halys TaxID=286706 RepID=UPI0006D51B23|nr:cytochrome P450 4C1-like [Halyomorpha halys]XP_014290658.1 cytochrome P450 4C1-like [Halyomorpha halys]